MLLHKAPNLLSNDWIFAKCNQTLNIIWILCVFATDLAHRHRLTLTSNVFRFFLLLMPKKKQEKPSRLMTKIKKREKKTYRHQNQCLIRASNSSISVVLLVLSHRINDRSTIDSISIHCTCRYWVWEQTVAHERDVSTHIFLLSSLLVSNE